ncbi:hypothetical protein ABHI18_009828 [Aspergillus niger]
MPETGIVKWYDDDKGYGFVTADSGGEDLFAHKSAIKGEFASLRQNQRVSFEVQSGPGGRVASNIQAL